MDDGDQSGQIVAFTEDPTQSLVYLVRLTKTGWVVTPTRGMRACTSVDGSRAVIGNVFTVKEREIPLPAEATGDAQCRVSKSTVVFGHAVTIYDQTGKTLHTYPGAASVRFLSSGGFVLADMEGRVTWHQELPSAPEA